MQEIIVADEDFAERGVAKGGQRPSIQDDPRPVLR